MGALAHLRLSRSDFLLRSAERLGDVYWLDLVSSRVLVVGHPVDGVRIVSNRDGKYPDKGGATGIRASTLPFVGGGLSTWNAPDAEWLRRRRSFRPLYRIMRPPGFDALDELEHTAPGGRQLAHIVQCEILGDMVFHLLGIRPPAAEVDALAAHLANLTRAFWVGKARGAQVLPWRRSQASVRHVETRIGAWCAAATNYAAPILSHADELALTAVELRDEVASQLLSVGTTAVAVVWALYLLAQAPSVQSRLQAELLQSGYVPGAGPEPDYLTWTVREALRLCPSTYWIQRRAAEDDLVRGHHVEAGTRVVVLVPRVHQHPDFWPRPAAFDPLRFADGASHSVRYWMPFGMGSRTCVAREYATGLLARVLAQVTCRYRITAPGSKKPQLVPSFSLLARPHPELRFERL